MTRFRVPVFLALAVSGLSGCPNLFDPLDNPSGDEQLLSAARACFDRQEYDCAQEYYSQLGGETAAAEQAFMILDQQGLGTDTLVTAVAGGDSSSVGEILNRLVESARGGGSTGKPEAGATKRAALLTAYNKLASISNVEIRGFVQFVVAFALAAELLAEQTGVADGVFEKTDLASGASCAAATCGTAVCDAATGGLAGGAGTDGDDLTVEANYGTVSASGVPASLESVNQAITAAANGIEDMNVQSGSTFSLLEDITNLGISPSGVPRCYRAGLIELGIGR